MVVAVLPAPIYFEAFDKLGKLFSTVWGITHSQSRICQLCPRYVKGRSNAPEYEHLGAYLLFVGSLSGGTGSGMLVDITPLVVVLPMRPVVSI